MASEASENLFRFKKFSVDQSGALLKIGTDSVLLGAWAEVGKARRGLDIGAGTGVLSLMAAQKFEAASAADFRIDAVEIDGPSAERARANFEASKWSDRLTTHETSIQRFAQTASERYDFIVSNPPFFSGGNFSANGARHNFQLPNGELLSAVRRLLAPEGRFFVVLPLLEGLRFAELASQYGLFATRQTEVTAKAGKPVERLLLRFEKNPMAFEKNSLTVQDEQGLTAAYRALTADFLL